MIAEINGLATDKYGNVRAMGLAIRGDKILGYINDGKTEGGVFSTASLFEVSDSLSILDVREDGNLSKDLSLVFATLVAINSAMHKYQVFEANSNSVATHVLEVLGIDVETLRAASDKWTPGTNRDILSSEQISQIQSVFAGVDYGDVGVVKSIEFTDNGTMVIETDNPGQWINGEWDDDGDGIPDPGSHDITDPPPPRPEGLGDSGGGGLAPSTSDKPKPRPEGLGQPIVIDINGNGVEVSTGLVANFDFDGDGYQEAGAWVGKDDGFLVLDRQDNGATTANSNGTFGDGKITRADELVLSLLTETPDDTDLQAVKSSWLNNLRADASGTLDVAVQERILNRFDQGWAHLRVWQDLDQDGETDAGELKTLDDLGITQINLTYDDGSAFSTRNDDITVGLATLRGLASYVRNGETIKGGIGDMALGHDELGWRRVAVTNASNVVIGYEYQFETGKRWRATELATQVSKDFNLTEEAFDAAQGDDRDNVLTATGAARAVQITGGNGADTIRGGNADDMLAGGVGADYLYGNDGDDLIVADSADIVNGIVAGGRGFDTLMIENDQSATVRLKDLDIESAVGGGGADTLSALDLYEDVRLFGMAGADRLVDGFGDDVLSGDDGNDTLIAADGDDWLGGGKGTDELRSGSGDDQLDGGSSGDSLVSGSGDDLVYGGLGNDTIYGGTEDDRLEGGANDDELFAGFGDDTLNGGSGNDTLSFWNGDAEISGGTGNDVIEFKRLEEHGDSNFWGWTFVFGGKGTDVIRVAGQREDWEFRHVSGNQYQIYRSDNSSNKMVIDLVDVERIKFLGGGADRVLDGVADTVDTSDDYWRQSWDTFIGDDNNRLFLNEGYYSNGILNGWMGDDTISGFGFGADWDYNDTIHGGTGSDALIGIDGNDSLAGSTGQDTLAGGDGTDTISGGAGADQAAGGSGNDSIVSASGSDIVWGGSGRDAIYGGSGGDVLIGDGDADTIWGGTGADQLSGDAGNDQLFGETGYDKLYGGDGADSLNGGAGSDYLYGGAGNDTLTGDDTLGSGFNYLAGGEGHDVLNGGEYDDQLAGEAGNDTLRGGIGRDVLMGGAGADDLLGGDGLADAISYETSEARVVIDLDANTLAGGDAQGDQIWYIEQVIGSQHDDVLRADALDNLLAGAGGDDTLNGRAGDDDLFGDLGDDSLVGEDGVDRLYGGGGNDLLYGGAGEDTVDGGAGGRDKIDFSAAGAGLVVDLTYASNNAGAAAGDLYLSIEEVEGSDNNDILNGNAAANKIVGGNGNDTLNGRDGADTLYGSAGRDTATYLGSSEGVHAWLNETPEDTLTGSGGRAEGDRLYGIENLIGSAHQDLLVGMSLANLLAGGDGNDVLRGNAGADTLDGGAGADQASYSAAAARVTVNLETGATSGTDALGDIFIGIENLFGSAFNDSLTGDAGVNVLIGADGDDTLRGGAGNDTLTGREGADVIDGGEGRDSVSYVVSDARVVVNLLTGSVSGGDAAGDVLIAIENVYGSAFADVLTGDDLANRLVGGDGDDSLRGNGGADDFVFGTDFGTDRIADFEDGIDQIDLRGYLKADGSSIIGTGALLITVDGTDALVQVRGTDDVIRLVGAAGQVSASDFIFADA
jgi:Ca2+-binding RTX toxin-like protein